MKKLLKNTFVPHAHNQYTPHLFKKGSVVVIAAIILVAFFGGIMQKIQLYSSESLAAVYAKTLVALANEDRSEESLEELAVNPLLVEAARLKAEHMATNGYFSHYGPDGTAPWDWLNKAGYQYAYAGENLAIDFTDSYDVNRAWMRSPMHRANIMSVNYSEIGIATASGIYKGKETVFVVQMFGSPKKRVDIATTPGIPASTTVYTVPTSAIVATTTAVATDTQETFVAVKGAFVEIADVAVTDTLVTNPSKVIAVVFSLLFVIVSFGLLGVIFSEFHKHHIKHAIIGVVLLVVIVALAYAYKAIIVSKILII